MNKKLMVLLSLAALLALAGQALAYEVAAVENGGSLTGTISFKGDVPKLEPIPVTKDEQVCHADVPDETMVVGEKGGLANVVVYFEGIESGKDPKSMPKVTLANAECRYQPHVSAIMVGQKLIVTNEDPILHNTHAYINGEKTIFNRALPIKGQKMNIKMKQPGVVNAKCDAGHTWMDAWVMVTKNPYYAVTDDTGAFEIADIPPGDYTVKVWHEKLGEQEKKVTIAAGKPATLDLAMTAEGGASK